MSNETKKRLAILDARVLQLENMVAGMLEGVQGVIDGAQSSANIAFSCGQCGTHEPIINGFVCFTPNCKMGLNPADDEE